MPSTDATLSPTSVFVQVNPVRPDSLLAIFPLCEVPLACVALAFSRDGDRFSKPVSLVRSHAGWRTANANGTGRIEFRAPEWRVSPTAVLEVSCNGGIDYVRYSCCFQGKAKPRVRIPRNDRNSRSQQFPFPFPLMGSAMP